MSEIQIQFKAYQYLYNKYPQIRLCLFHVPNGGTRNIIEATQLKASGITPGIPDLLLLWGKKLFACEVKKPGGKITPAQKLIHEVWSKQGVIVKVAYSSDEIVEWAEEIILT
jgi:VRR-NUC domain